MYVTCLVGLQQQWGGQQTMRTFSHNKDHQEAINANRGREGEREQNKLFHGTTLHKKVIPGSLYIKFEWGNMTQPFR